MTRFILSLIPLVLVYLLMLPSVQPWDLAGGTVVATAALLLFRRFLYDAYPVYGPSPLRRLFAFVPFALAVVWEIVVGTWNVAVTVLRLRPLREPGIVAIPIGERTQSGIVVTMSALTLSPGSVLVDIDWEQRVMLFHFLDASEPEKLVAYYQEFYWRYQRPVFP